MRKMNTFWYVDETEVRSQGNTMSLEDAKADMRENGTRYRELYATELEAYEALYQSLKNRLCTALAKMEKLEKV